jgi:hypothetical protein
MWIWLNATLKEFRYCFSNKRAFGWFIIIVIGLMIRSDQVGLTSIVRAFGLEASAYMSILHFFRAESWYIGQVQLAWLRILSKSPLLYRISGRTILIADGVKQSKEGRRMPGVKKLHQESENSAKGEYIFGHMRGGLGVLVGNISSKLYCILVSLKLHDGIEAIQKWGKDESYNEESHVVKMIKDAIDATRVFGESLLLLDRLFLTIPMLETLSSASLLHVITKAKLNATAYPKFPRIYLLYY